MVSKKDRTNKNPADAGKACDSLEKRVTALEGIG